MLQFARVALYSRNSSSGSLLEPDRQQQRFQFSFAQVVFMNSGSKDLSPTERPLEKQMR